MALAFCDEEAVVDFALWLQALNSQLTMLASPSLTRRRLPCIYGSPSLTIETLIDLATLSLEDVIGHLKAVEDRMETTTTTANDKLLLTEEWVAQMHEKRSKEGSSSRSSDGKRRSKASQKKDDDDASRLVDKDTC
jgi:hypothetical protein